MMLLLQLHPQILTIIMSVDRKSHYTKLDEIFITLILWIFLLCLFVGYEIMIPLHKICKGKILGSFRKHCQMRSENSGWSVG